jgi:hypothetical protein
MAEGFDKIIETINRRIGQMLDVEQRTVARLYARILTEIRLELTKIYESYEVDGKLTLTEMSKYDRLNKFLDQIFFNLETGYKELAKTLPNLMGEAYLEGYYLFAYGAETLTASKLAYSTVAPAALAAAVANPIDNLSPRIWLRENMTKTVQTFRTEIQQGLYRGETYGTMSKRVKTVLEADANKVMRVIRTEGHRVQEKSKQDAAKHADKNGVRMLKTWNSSEDERVRKGKANHRKLNNKTIPVDGLFDDGLGRGPAPGQMGAAGSDINCRCFLTYTVDRIEKPDHAELENMTFDDWKKERLKKA